MTATLADRTVATAWQRIVGSAHGALTIVDDQAERVPYPELIARAAAQLPALRALGVGRGEPVLLTAHTATDFVTSYLGLMLYGAVPVPVPPKQALKAGGQFLARLGPLLTHHRRLICTPAEREEVRTIAPTGCQLSTYAELALAADGEFGRTCVRRLATGDPRGLTLSTMDDDAYVQYTSGSTAAPRGVVITYQNLLTNLEITGRGYGFRPGDVLASWLPLHHDMGLVASLNAALFNGIPAVFTTPQRFLYDPLGFLRLLTESAATHALMPNFALEWLINARNRRRADLSGIDLRALRTLIISAEPVSPDSMRRFADAFTDLGLSATTLCSAYGLAEATAAVAISAPGTGFRTESHHGTEVVTAGRVLDGYEVRIDAPPGERAGTIKLRGPSVSSRAYVNGAKVDVLDAEGFHDTRDLGYLAGGELVCLGRQDEVFIVRGENRFPYDIEAVVRAESGGAWSRAACFGAEGHVVVVVEHRGAALDTAGIDRLRQRITAVTGLAVDELIPVRRGTIPVTTSGKIRRGAVAELYRAGALSRLDAGRPA